MSVFCFYRHLSLKACGHVFRFRFSLEDKRGLSLGELIRHFTSCVYINIYCIMGCYYTLYLNTYGYSLLFYKVYMKRENAGSWNSGLEKEQILKDYSMQLQKSWNSTEYLKINKETSSSKMKAKGPTPCSRGCPPGHAPLPRGPSGGSPTPIFSHMKSFDEQKIE